MGDSLVLITFYRGLLFAMFFATCLGWVCNLDVSFLF